MANEQAISQALQAVAKALTVSLQATLADLNLDNTGLQKSIESEVSGGDTVTAYMIEYGRYVISGRRKFVKKVPIAALLKWISEKGLKPRVAGMTTNSLAFAIQNAIYKNGIKGRDFITPSLDDDFLALAEKLLLDALEQEFDQVLA